MITLSDPQLGEVELRSRPFVVRSFQIGSPETRQVVRPRALANGSYDDTRFTGARAVTVALELGERYCASPAGLSTMQDLYDRILPFMAPRRRPTMTWSLPGSGGVLRQMTVRGQAAPVVIARAKHPSLVLQFVAPSGEITTPGEHATYIEPAVDTVDGRTYDLTFDRTYPTSAPVGDRTIVQNGNEEAHWRLTLFGEVVDPAFRINDVTIAFTENGGLTVPAGSSVVLDTRERTVYLNDDPTTPVYDRTNFTEWSWGDVLLQPGANVVRFSPDSIDGGQALLSWYDTWA